MARKRSWVWEHCTKFDDGLTAKCNICEEDFQIKGSTSSLNKHLRIVHGYSDDNKLKRQKLELNNSEISQETESEEQGSSNSVDINDVNSLIRTPEESESSFNLSSTSTFETSTPLPHPRRILKARRTDSSVSRCSKSRAENIDQALSKLIVTNMLPISFVESTGFKDFMATVEPGYKVPCKATIKKRIDLLYNLTKETIKRELEAASSVVAVSDCWTSRAQDSFLTVSAHYLSETWEPKCLCLATQEADERHNAENLSTRMSEIISDYGLQGKVTTVVTDNAANAVNSVHLMEDVDETIDVQCAAHTLQLGVNDGLKLTEIKNLCSKASRIVSHFKHSNVAGYALENKQKMLRLSPLKLIQSCPTRWNSVYFMIERLIKNRSAIQAVLADRTLTKSHIAAKLDISEIEWKHLEDISEILMPVELTTKVLCAETSSVAIVRPLIRNLIFNHLKPKKGEEDIVNTFRAKVKDSLSTRFQMGFNGAISASQISTFLDPRYKDLNGEDCATLIRETVRQKLLNSAPKPTSDIAKNKPSILDILFKVPTDETNTAISQFENYLREPNISHNLCPYTWWKNNEVKFSYFVPLVRKYLSIPATSTASERVFSTAGNIVSSKRSCLSSDNVDKLIFLYQNRLYVK